MGMQMEKSNSKITDEKREREKGGDAQTNLTRHKLAGLIHPNLHPFTKQFLTEP